MQILVTCINLLFGWNTVDFDFTGMQESKGAKVRNQDAELQQIISWYYLI